MTQLKRGRFINEYNPQLYNELAYVRLTRSKDVIMAQFDNLELPTKYTYGWVYFPAKHFEILEEK